MQFINTLEENVSLRGECYLCQDKQGMITKNGKPYLKLVLADKTGAMNAMIWNVDNRVQAFEKNDVVAIDGTVTSYMGEKQFSVTTIRKALENEYDPSNYYRCAEESPESLYGRIRVAVASVANPYLHQLLERFFPASGAQKEAFLMQPAAKGFHHNYRAGLAEHTVSVLNIAQSLSRQYPSANSDLVTAGALLHDIGKMKELSPAPACDYTDAGRLAGHIAMGAIMINAEAAQISGFPEDTLLQLTHVILSHHGSLEFGSPVLPATAEAMIVHLADDADAKLNELRDGVELDREEGSWTAFNKALQRYLYKPEKKNE